MLDHVSIGVKDLAAARRFYEAALTPLGYACAFADDSCAGFGAAGAIGFWLNPTDHPVAADPRSGLHFCFAAPSRKAVDAFHARALAAGGRDNGKPGLRPGYGAAYYAAFVVDPEGYRIEAHTEAPA